MTYWTVAQTEVLRSMWPLHSASQIAKRLQVSRNAVIGRANRLGLLKSPDFFVTPRGRFAKGHRYVAVAA